jgi:hypothetical protein
MAPILPRSRSVRVRSPAPSVFSVPQNRNEGFAPASATYRLMFERQPITVRPVMG